MFQVREQIVTSTAFEREATLAFRFHLSIRPTNAAISATFSLDLTQHHKSVLHSSRDTAGQNQEPRMQAAEQGACSEPDFACSQKGGNVQKLVKKTIHIDSHTGTKIGLWIRNCRFAHRRLGGFEPRRFLPQ